MIVSGIDEELNLVHTYSNDGKMIIQDQTGVEYEEAWDVLDSGFTYTESENDRPSE